MNRQLVGLGIWGLVVAAGLAAVPAWAVAPAPLEVKQVHVGLAGRFQVGSWTPVAATVIVSGGAPLPVRLVVIAPDADGQLVHTSSPEQVLAPGQPQTLDARFLPGRATGEIIVRVEAQNGYRHEQRLRLAADGEPGLKPGFRQDVPFWGLCGVSDKVFDKAFEEARLEAAKPAALNQRDEPIPELIPLLPSDLPSESADYAALDVLILAAAADVPGTGKSFLSQLTPRQQQALRDWVQIRGGHLVLSLGSHLKEFQQSELSDWLKLPALEETDIRQLDGLESYSPHPSVLHVDGTVASLRIGPTVGNVLARSLDGPLLVQLPVGFGRVSFLTVDVDQPPLKSWDGLGHLFGKVLGTERDQVRSVRIKGTQLAKSAVNDLSSQLIASQDEFPGVIRLSLWSVMGLLGVYILIVGPFDYWLVHHWLKRPHWTWLTLGGWVVLGSGLIIGASNWLNGTQLRSTQLEIVDLDQTSNLLRAQSWLTLYSPRTARTAIEMSPGTSAWSSEGKLEGAPPLVSWVAPAENRVGGLYREGGVQLTQREYRTLESTGKPGSAAGFGDYPLQVWSTGRVGAEWSGTTPRLVESNLVSTELGRLAGSVTHHLPGTLSDCLLAYANRVYFPVTRRTQGAGRSDLASHFTWEIGGGQPVEQRDLRSFLTQVYTKEIKRVDSNIPNELLDLQTPYDSARRDQEYIIRMLTFHQAAGGPEYTGMRHDVLGGFDLSMHLRLGRAVLLGRLKKSSAEWKVNGAVVTAPDAQTFVRIVLPVNRADEENVRAILKPDE